MNNDFIEKKPSSKAHQRRPDSAGSHSGFPNQGTCSTEPKHALQPRRGFDIANIPNHSPDHVVLQIEPDNSQGVAKNEQLRVTENGDITNISAETIFLPLSSTSCRDEEYYYFFHGTFLKNLDGIAQQGLDPTQGGGKKGASQYENIQSSDARGLMKYATDPNIAMIYSASPTEMDQPEIGVLLQARVRIDTVKTSFNDKSDKNSSTPFWRRERGGEDGRNILGIKPHRLALNEKGGEGEYKPIRAVETNTLVPPEDIKVIGIHLPSKGSIKEGDIPNNLLDF